MCGVAGKSSFELSGAHESDAPRRSLASPISAAPERLRLPQMGHLSPASLDLATVPMTLLRSFAIALAIVVSVVLVVLVARAWVEQPAAAYVQRDVDTLEVDPGDKYVVAFRADNPGLWMDHCHNLRHATAGMTMHVMYVNVWTPYTIGGPAHNAPE